jgi:hypothetical protein
MPLQETEGIHRKLNVMSVNRGTKAEWLWCFFIY